MAEAVKVLVIGAGFRPDFVWIKVPIFDAWGFPVHARRISKAPGLYFLGLPSLHKWKSATFLGVGEDAEFLADHLATRRPTSRRS
jgi:putative flavoprotein involved in K+ transport